MNKLIKKLFSLPKAKLIPVLVVGLLVAGVASAQLVVYLGNLFTADVNVESPTELKLYNEASEEINSTFTIKGGENIGFYKIAKNNADVGIKFAIALAIENVVAGEVTVDSAGPCPGDVPNKNTIAYWAENGWNMWNDTGKWCQIENQDWYLHDAYNKSATYEWWNDVSNVWVNGGNPQNTVYDDGGMVTVNDKDYYFVVFGGTIGTVANGAIGSWEKITNEGWGTPSEYTSTSGGDPNVMIPGVADVGKVRIHFAQNSDPTVNHQVGMRVVQPGSTVAEVVAAMGF